MSYIEIAMGQLVIDEGKRDKMYLDGEGIPTIGIGHNLRDRPISERAIRVIFEDDMAEAERDARSLVSAFDQLSNTRKAVLVNMAFNLGRDRLAGFKNMLAHVNAGEFTFAADEMLRSKWATQVGVRAQRLAQAMRLG